MNVKPVVLDCNCDCDECGGDPDNWNHCHKCDSANCDMGPNAQEGWTYDDISDSWTCRKCNE
jgi:hypothetical protein